MTCRAAGEIEVPEGRFDLVAVEIAHEAANVYILPALKHRKVAEVSFTDIETSF
jgi:hypothetical protein